MSPEPRAPAGRGACSEGPACPPRPPQGFFTDEDTQLGKKLTLYVEDNWNKCDMVAIFLFIVGVTCRSGGQGAAEGARAGPPSGTPLPPTPGLSWGPSPSGTSSPRRPPCPQDAALGV